MVNRRDLLVKDGTCFKNGLHEQVSIAYPSYRRFFSEIDGKGAMYFWKAYPSPLHLQGKTAEELAEEIREISRIFKKSKAESILECVGNDDNTFREYQESRDFIRQSLVRDLEHQKEELAGIDQEIEKLLLTFDYKLTSMLGIGTAFASMLIAEIGDIRRLRNADKLARYAGVARSSSVPPEKGRNRAVGRGTASCMDCFICWPSQWWQYRSQEDRIIRCSTDSYYMRKISEGKTKSRALF